VHSCYLIRSSNPIPNPDPNPKPNPNPNLDSAVIGRTNQTHWTHFTNTRQP